MGNKKQSAQDFGKFAEEMVAQRYIKNGYVVLERNWRLGKTEIDLIAAKDSTIVIIEVKARNGEGEEALNAVTHDKRRRMVRAADFYISNLEGSREYRFDLATVTGNERNFEMEIYEDAFVAADFF